MNETMYGWYSAKQAELLEGATYYYLADDPSRKVTVTQVTQTMEHNTGWDDIEYVGEVGQFIKTTIKHSQITEKKTRHN